MGNKIDEKMADEIAALVSENENLKTQVAQLEAKVKNGFSQVAELERIKLDDAYELNIIQYLSDLVYIKEKQKNERKMMEEIKRGYK